MHQTTQITGCIPLWFQCVLETKSYSSQFIFKYSSWALFFLFTKWIKIAMKSWKIRWYFWHLAAVFVCCFKRYSQVPGKAGSGHPVRHLACWFPCLLLWTCCGFILSTCFFRFKYSAVHISLCLWGSWFLFCSQACHQLLALLVVFCIRFQIEHLLLIYTLTCPHNLLDLFPFS